jgi:hypothetical protein
LWYTGKVADDVGLVGRSVDNGGAIDFSINMTRRYPTSIRFGGGYRVDLEERCGTPRGERDTEHFANCGVALRDRPRRRFVGWGELVPVAPSTPNTAEGCPSALAACPFGEPLVVAVSRSANEQRSATERATPNLGTTRL